MTEREMIREAKRFFGELGRADAIAGVTPSRDGPTLRLLLERLVKPYGFSNAVPFTPALNAYPPMYRRARREATAERVRAATEFWLWPDEQRGAWFACYTCGSDPANPHAPRFGVSSTAIGEHLLTVGHRARAAGRT